jgi:hypothetical protein
VRARKLLSSLALLGVVRLLTACAQDEAHAASKAEPAASKAEPAPLAARSAESSIAVGRGIEHACNNICARSRALKCPHVEECLPNCLGMASVTPCKQQFLAFYECLIDKPSKDWECSEDGVASIRPGLCEREQGDAVACLERLPPQ